MSSARVTPAWSARGYQRPDLLDKVAAFGHGGHPDAPAAPELQQSLVAELAERAQDRVGVDPEQLGEIAGGRDPFPGLALPRGDGPADRRGHLLVQGAKVLFFEAQQHGANENSTIVSI